MATRERQLRPETMNSLEYAWPEVLTPRDPYCGDEARPDPGDYKNYLAFCGLEPEEQLSREAHDAANLAFLGVYRQILDGAAPWSAIEPLAERLAVDGPIRHDRRPIDPAPIALGDDVLADHAEDWVPDLGLMLERVLGPWSDLALPPAVRRQAAAAMCFSPLIFQGQSAMDRIFGSDPKPSVAHRAALRAIGLTPPMVWAIQPDHSLRPLLPVARAPIGPVRGLPQAPAVLGRAVVCEQGDFLACAIPLPGLPPKNGMLRRLHLELLWLRRLERRSSWEDVLRRRPEVLYRTALSWAWLVGRDAEKLNLFNL